MKRLLFISNGSKPTEEQYCSVGEEKITNFSLPIVNACEKMGIDVTIGINKKYATQMTCQYPVKFYNAEVYRNPFNFKEVWRAYKNACTELRKGGYIGIHCNTPIGGFVGRIAGKRNKISKIIYTAHGFHFYKGAPKLNWLIYYPIEKWLARYTDALITINHEDFEFAKKKMKLRNNGKVYYVPGVGIDIVNCENKEEIRQKKRMELGLCDDNISLISMGDLVERKNYSASIRAIAEAKNDKLHYFICGEGPEEANLKKLAVSLGVDNQIHFIGFRTDINELLAASDIFLFTTKQEGLPRSMMEAMASGLPCVVSKIRGNVDLIEEGKGGFLCAPDDASGFANAINIVANDKELRNNMKEYNEEIIKKFEVSVVKEEMEKIYSEVFS